MFYSHTKYRGLGILWAAWEAKLQHFAIAKKLSTVNDAALHLAFNCNEEMYITKNLLRVTGDTTNALRQAFQEKAFTNWSIQMARFKNRLFQDMFQIKQIHVII